LLPRCAFREMITVDLLDIVQTTRLESTSRFRGGIICEVIFIVFVAGDALHFTVSQ
jgi:hypothetical protein